MAAITSGELQDAWQKIKKMNSLPEAPNPTLPVFTAKTPMKTRLLAIQNYLNTLEYNYTGTLYFDVNKNRSFKSIVNTAKEIMAEVLPIQCLEAVFLASYLTANLPELERFPISFKSEAGSSVHRHIVLAVRHQNKWGALGLSRSEKLMYKELRFNSMSELIQDYCHGFQSVCHSVAKVYLGFPFPHDIHSSEKVEWRVLNIPLSADNWTEVASHLDSFGKEALDILAFKRAKGALADNFQNKYPLHTPEKEPGKKSPDKRSQLAGGAFEFPFAISSSDETEGVSTPPPAATSASPEKDDSKKATSPILVAPDALVFKRALANQAQVLPSNVFLQNTTTSAFIIEVEESTGQLEIVTKSTAPLKSQQEEAATVSAETAAAVGTAAARGSAESTVAKSNSSSFRVSAKGMIVIAIKYKQPRADAAASPATNTTAHATPTAQSTARKGSSELRRTRTPRSGVTSPQKTAAPVVPPKNVVYFRCTRLARATEEQANEMESAETYTTELPFSVTS